MLTCQKCNSQDYHIEDASHWGKAICNNCNYYITWLPMTQDIICHRCGSINDYHTVPSGPHLKAICNGCDRYIKFLPQHTNDKYIHTNDAGRKPVNTDKMSTLINGSMCFTDLCDQAKKGHSAFTKGKNGKIYFNITEWVNDEPDQFGYHASFQLNSSKEKKEAEGKVYIGNGKLSQGQQAAPATQNDIAANIPSMDQLPF